MTVRARKFTPEVMLSAPRRSAGIPNHDASSVLYTVSTYCFQKHEKTSEVRVLDVKSQKSVLVTADAGASNPRWLGEDGEVVMLVGGEDGCTKVVVGKPNKWSESYTAGTIAGPVSDLKIVSLDGNKFGIAVSGKATPEGDLFNPTNAPKPHTSGRLYKELFVRHWDHYITENRNSIFLAQLRKEDGKFKLTNFHNALKGTGLESPVEPFGGMDNFDISATQLVCVAKIPVLNPALHTRTGLYLTSSSSSDSQGNMSIWSDANPKQFCTISSSSTELEGAITNPVFSPNGKTLAFLQMKTDGYESDKNQVLIAPEINKPGNKPQGHILLPSKDGKGSWDLSPSSIIWSQTKGQPALCLVAEDHGRVCLFRLDPGPPGNNPTKLITGSHITSVQALSNGDIFLSSDSLIDNSLYSLLTSSQQSNLKTPLHLPDNTQPDPEKCTKPISSQSRHGTTFGLHRSQIHELYWPGATEDTEIHAWMVRPSNFDKNKKYPLAYLIHGGPQGAWGDAWSTRWNPAVFAEQGYIVVCPNPTGSTGYGQAFTDAIQGQWGGLPYQDLVNGIDWIGANLEYVDTERMVALGASYGGYMVNWIQGHDLGRRFKALVTHDGVFSMTNQLASEELYFPFHDLRGALWKNPESWAQWDPSRFLQNWATPHLIIHSELDYRLTISEGLAAFHTLQARGVPSGFLTFPDENHWVLKHENSLLWHRTVLEWIGGFVGLGVEV
ncbi:dipeptidyl-peptidase 5 precursor [Sporormia fimetaria CBS 119925]|uniref:Dipeptidyl-peptidase V n=1 Tax=Sporormia fimetaria CBS 119925 TaxID=1340428 RepID=A0A6A6VLP9_9PLEO|nr:dipeptidyl-peptidase 5 precursor [Sporormia fimetaria CBS 119925]